MTSGKKGLRFCFLSLPLHTLEALPFCLELDTIRFHFAYVREVIGRAWCVSPSLYIIVRIIISPEMSAVSHSGRIWLTRYPAVVIPWGAIGPHPDTIGPLQSNPGALVRRALQESSYQNDVICVISKTFRSVYKLMQSNMGVPFQPPSVHGLKPLIFYHFRLILNSVLLVIMGNCMYLNVKYTLPACSHNVLRGTASIEQLAPFYQKLHTTMLGVMHI